MKFILVHFVIFFLKRLDIKLNRVVILERINKDLRNINEYSCL